MHTVPFVLCEVIADPRPWPTFLQARNILRSVLLLAGHVEAGGLSQPPKGKRPHPCSVAASSGQAVCAGMCVLASEQSSLPAAFISLEFLPWCVLMGFL